MHLIHLLLPPAPSEQERSQQSSREQQDCHECDYEAHPPFESGAACGRCARGGSARPTCSMSTLGNELKTQQCHPERDEAHPLTTQLAVSDPQDRLSRGDRIWQSEGVLAQSSMPFKSTLPLTEVLS